MMISGRSGGMQIMTASSSTRTNNLRWSHQAALFVLLLITGHAYAATDTAAEKLVRAADAIRLPQEDFQVDVTITNVSPDSDREERRYRVLSKGHDDTVIQTLYPPTERGQILLMKGRDLWAFMPDVSQPIRLSLAQRLTGQVANGDLARANFAGDYTASLLRSDTLEGSLYNVLQLRAVDRSVTYARVLYWIAKKDARPYKAEFYSASGRLLKTCLYREYRNAGGASRPTKLIIEDALRQGEKSILDYSQYRVRPLPDKLFTKDYLKKLQ